MTSSLAVDVIGPLTTAAMQSILDDCVGLTDDDFVKKIGECRHSIGESLEYCTKASKADRGWRDSELTEAVVVAYVQGFRNRASHRRLFPDRSRRALGGLAHER